VLLAVWAKTAVTKHRMVARAHIAAANFLIVLIVEARTGSTYNNLTGGPELTVNELIIRMSGRTENPTYQFSIWRM